MSLTVQGLPSVHVLLIGRKTQPATGSQPSDVHSAPSSHGMLKPVHAPVLQLSLVVQTLASSQAPRYGMWVQPVVALQLSMVHGLPSLQSVNAAPKQMVPSQTSPLVHASPSSQVAPLAVVWVQPKLVSHWSVVHGLPSAQDFDGKKPVPSGLQRKRLSPTHTLLKQTAA